MSIIVGMDEAGLGPNLGPLVIAATVWRVPEQHAEFDFFTRLNDVVTNQPQKQDMRFHVGDSKSVYSSGKGIASLERSVQAMLHLNNALATSYCELIDRLCLTATTSAESPWLFEQPLPIPLTKLDVEFSDRVEYLKRECQRHSIELIGIHCDLISESRFNNLIDKLGNKSELLTRSCLNLLRSFWEPASEECVSIFCDKHGGRNRYDPFLAEITDNMMIFRGNEGRHWSDYRIGNTKIAFLTKAERYFPVAVASMIAKYLRELSMLQLNQFWQQHLPNLKATAGYPVDAKRFYASIEKTAENMKIQKFQIWRKR